MIARQHSWGDIRLTGVPALETFNSIREGAAKMKNWTMLLAVLLSLAFVSGQTVKNSTAKRKAAQSALYKEAPAAKVVGSPVTGTVQERMAAMNDEIDELYRQQAQATIQLESMRNELAATKVLLLAAQDNTEFKTDDTDEIKDKLHNLEDFKEKLCSAIKFSLTENGTSATVTGGELWNACN